MPYRQPRLSGRCVRRVFARSLSKFLSKFLRIVPYIIYRIYDYLWLRLNLDRKCIIYLAVRLLSILPIFFYRIHADAARMARHARGVDFFGRDLGEVVRKNMLASRFLPVSLAIRALGVVMTGSIGNSVHRVLLDMDLFQYSLLSQRERFAATYETFFLPSAMCLAVLYADSNKKMRRVIPRTYELFTRFYLRLLREPEALFRNPMPPRIIERGSRISQRSRLALRNRNTPDQ
ncbi:hypothetical protein BBAD15_g2473 [Beauveria bassiana D1-5]|uniref:Uncharacterized protein n=1 Tax=Beauveria bassiana D1-5 TaxID=1245745 RepID=A0A0A2VV49_BEABA|nr:hypothetical protein BBAD15_g2473 [Beauveria bassiana D1-5]